jgi:tetratricopeptide (TPR) repeat protein
MRRNRVKIYGFLLLTAWAFSSLFPLGCGQAPTSRIPSRARWHNNQGVVYMDQHNYTRAKTEFEKAIGLVPHYATGHANLGIAYYSLGKYDSATVALQTSLQHDPALLQAHYTLGLILNAQGKDHKRALQALETVARTDPDDPHLLYYMGQVRAKLGQADAAVADLRRAISMDQYNVSAYYALANQFRRMNRRQEWRETLQTFNNLSQAGHQGVSSSYQGQGRYAEAVTDVSGANPAQDDAGVPFSFAPAVLLDDLPATVTSATATDWDGDGSTDLLVLDGQLLCYRNDGSSLTLDPSAQPVLPPDMAPTHVLAADFDNNGDIDLVFSGRQLLYMMAGESGRWEAPIPLQQAAQRAFAADVDHDGDLDLLVSTAAGSRLLTNDGRGEFTDFTTEAALDEAVSAQQIIFSDFDNDRDIDFFILGREKIQLFTNNRDGTFTDVAAAAGLSSVKPAIDICVEDFDQDQDMDLCLLDAGGTLTLYANQEGNQFTPGPPITAPVDGAYGLRPVDLDNDGDLDLAIFGANGIRLLAHRADRFHLEDPILLQGREIGQLLCRDFDGDGRTDLWSDGHLLRNQTEAGHWIKVAAQGLGSNRQAIGSKVEVKTVNRLQKQEIRDGEPLTFGLATADSVEFVRILWPGGVRQTELATSAGQTLSLAELDRKGTSCPIVYAWDGERFRFVSDINGGAIIGYLLAPNQYNTPDTDEYIRLGKIAPRDGRYIVKMANHLEEVIYADALQLIAVDHPRGVDIYPNERLLSVPPYPPFDIYPLENLHLPKVVSDHRGRDILPQLTAVDDIWYDDFELTDIHGFAREYSITLDLGDLERNRHPVLLAYGWVDYAHSTSNWAAYQRGLSLYPPRVEVPDDEGNWVEVCSDMGTPAGLPKHMLFDLQNLFLSDDYRLRITTNSAVYWDQFLVGTRADVPTEIHRLSPTSGDLRWRGYPEHTAVNGTFAFRYHYDRLQFEAPWGTHGGSFTRLGPVDELVGQVDDRFAIMFHGDELTVEFAAAALPPLKPGWERSFLLYSDGFGKDMDFHSAHSQSVEPLPFHNMSSYPYPAGETYPQTQAHLDYLLDYNTRGVKGYYQ